MARSIANLFSALLLITSVPALAEPILNIEGGLIGDDNVNNGLRSRDKKSDVQEYVNVVFGHAISVGDDSSLALTGNIEGHYFNRYEGLNNVAPGLTLAYKTKLGLGPAPWLLLSGSASRLDYRDDVRNGWLYHADLSVYKQLTRQWYLTTGFRFEKRVADHAVPDDPDISGAAFDQSARSLACTLNYWHDNTTVFSAGYVWRRGDVVTSIEEPNDLEYKVSAITADKVFGAEFYAYKLPATTQLLNFSIGREISRQGMLNLQYQRRIAHANDDLNYYSSIVSVNYKHHF